MKDIDKFKDLLTSFGIGFKESHYYYDEEEYLMITLKEGYDKVKGYDRFYTDWNFDLDGTFIDINIWE